MKFIPNTNILMINNNLIKLNILIKFKVCFMALLKFFILKNFNNNKRKFNYNKIFKFI